MTSLHKLISVLLLAGASIGASAQDYPTRPIKVVVPYAAGSGVDLIARVTAPKLQKELGVVVVVDNRPGGSALIGAAAVAKAPADGYTLLMAGSGTHSSANALYKNVPYDVEKDFQPISNFIDADFFLIVRADSRIDSVADLLAWLQANQAKASFGYGSVTTQVAGLTFLKLTGRKASAVAYKGNGVALNDLLGGHIDFMFADQTVALPQIAAGKVKPLAVAARERRPDLPAVPTAIEQKVDMTINAWVGLVAPVDIPPQVRDKLAAAAANVLRDPEVREKLAASGRVSSPMTPADFGAYMKADRAAWESKIRAAGLEPQ